MHLFSARQSKRQCVLLIDFSARGLLSTHLYADFSFFLRSYQEPAEDGSSTIDKVAYSLIDNGLDDLPQFLDKLEHMKGEFTFHRDQLDVFWYQILQARYTAGDEEE